MTQSAIRIGQALTILKYFSIQQTGHTHSRYLSLKTFRLWNQLEKLEAVKLGLTGPYWALLSLT